VAGQLSFSKVVGFIASAAGVVAVIGLFVAQSASRS
jgi:hypothetical protein